MRLFCVDGKNGSTVPFNERFFSVITDSGQRIERPHEGIKGCGMFAYIRRFVVMRRSFTSLKHCEADVRLIAQHNAPSQPAQSKKEKLKRKFKVTGAQQFD